MTILLVFTFGLAFLIAWKVISFILADVAEKKSEDEQKQ